MPPPAASAVVEEEDGDGAPPAGAGFDKRKAGIGRVGFLDEGEGSNESSACTSDVVGDGLANEVAVG